MTFDPSSLTRWLVPRAPGSWPAGAVPPPEEWAGIPALPPFVLSHGKGAPEQATRARTAWSDDALHVLFECEDRDAWGSYLRRDDPVYEEEAVELFLAPGAGTPLEYFELEVSPRGTLFDARIANPHSRRSDMETDVAWDCPGLVWEVGSGRARQDWWAALAIPWTSLGVAPGTTPPTHWRANLYRIERPRDGGTEFSAWSPTLADPADFHKPERFGLFELSGAAPEEAGADGGGLVSR